MIDYSLIIKNKNCIDFFDVIDQNFITIAIKCRKIGMTSNLLYYSFMNCAFKENFNVAFIVHNSSMISILKEYLQNLYQTIRTLNNSIYVDIKNNTVSFEKTNSNIDFIPNSLMPNLNYMKYSPSSYDVFIYDEYEKSNNGIISYAFAASLIASLNNPLSKHVFTKTGNDKKDTDLSNRLKQQNSDGICTLKFVDENFTRAYS